jgi:predicted nucleic acid-binding protein
VVRHEKAKGIEWLRDVLDGGGVAVIQIDPECFADACRIYIEFVDKAWSFTDCTSYAVMRRLSITKALSFDDDFRQFGTVQVVP